MSIFKSHISGVNNIRYIVSSPVYKGRGVVARDLLEPPGGGTNVSQNKSVGLFIEAWLMKICEVGLELWLFYIVVYLRHLRPAS